jgi:serine/threonine protein kinase
MYELMHFMCSIFSSLGRERPFSSPWRYGKIGTKLSKVHKNMSLFNYYYYTTPLSHTAQYDTYLAYSEDDPEHRVILKVFDAKYILPTATQEDFQRTERRLLGLKHPHIVAMLELGREHGRPYLVSEYQPGGSLRQHLDHLSSGHLSLDNAAAIVMQVGQAAAFAHTQGVVHQDIRPENILLNDQGHALLTNFFLGDIIREPGLKDRSDRRAVSYLSPEQTIGIASPASDQYALGCLLYELVTGKFPNLVSSLRQHSPLVPMLPRTVETVILRALALKPEERYPSVTMFLAELKLVTQPEPLVSPHMMESANVPVIHHALSAHAHITSLDIFSRYEQTENVAEVVPQEYFVAEIESQEDQKEEQLAIPNPQDTLRSARMEVQSTVTVRASPTWKRAAGVIGAAVTLLVIVLLLAYSFNSGVRSWVKHVPALAVFPTLSSRTTAPSTAVPATAKPVATQKSIVQTPYHNHASGTSSNPVPTAIPKPLGIGSVQIDSGGSGAGSFVGDEDFSDITPGRPSRASDDSSSVIDTRSIRNPAPESVYQSARVGDCLYTISHLTPRASYAVRLHFAETYWTKPGKRTFNVTLNTRLVLHNFDIFATAGGENKAVVEQFVVPADSTGTITLQFLTVKNNAQINAIEVLAV